MPGGVPDRVCDGYLDLELGYHLRGAPYGLAGGRVDRIAAAAPSLQAIVASNNATIRAIAEAQQAGKISDRFAPVDLLALVLVIAAMWPALTLELAAEVRTHSTARRRKVTTDAVSALTAT